MARAVATASGVAMVLGAIGLYGVTPSLVAGRTRELAIRSALGARPGAQLGLVLAAGDPVIWGGPPSCWSSPWPRPPMSALRGGS